MFPLFKTKVSVNIIGGGGLRPPSEGLRPPSPPPWCPPLTMKFVVLINCTVIRDQSLFMAGVGRFALYRSSLKCGKISHFFKNKIVFKSARQTFNVFYSKYTNSRPFQITVSFNKRNYLISVAQLLLTEQCCYQNYNCRCKGRQF